MASSYLTRSVSSTGNRRTWTFSAWVKRSNVTQQYQNIMAMGSNNIRINFSNQNIWVYDYNGSGFDFYLVTNRVFRDTNAWYHIVVQVDTTQATSSNRVKLYVNGVQETSFSTETYPNQNHDTEANTSGQNNVIGTDSGNLGSNSFDGYISHIALVDGSVVAPTVFGQTDSTSGIWKFKSPTGVTWGTNGFHLKFENSGALGTDSSGNTNTFTVNGNLKQSIDTPSIVYATLNPLNSVGTGNNPTYSLANTKVISSSNQYFGGSGNMGVTTGKWYMEVKVEAQSSGLQGVIGMSTNIFEEARQNRHFGQLTTNPSAGYYASNGNKVVDGGTDASYGNTYTAGDIIGIAIDLDNNKLYFHKNGTYQNSGVPTSGSTGTGAISLTATDREWFLSLGDAGSSTTATYLCNFGDGFFGTTAIASAGSNGNGSLFEYDVPSGYYALNTKNLNTYG